jgi:hypothetical protein
MSREFPPFTAVRNVVLLIAGLLGIGYETVFDNAEKPTLIVLFGAMIGLPAFLAKDEKNSQQPPTIVVPPVPPPPATPPQTPAALPVPVEEHGA